jgi:tetratricopeptide (TPR) repeat protein
MVMAGAICLAWYWIVRSPVRPSVKNGSAGVDSFVLAEQQAVFATYGGSASCRECHEEAFAAWERSNHGLAERAVSEAMDKPAFDPPRQFRHGTQATRVNWQAGTGQVHTDGPHGTGQVFRAERVLGHDPLRQYLVEFPRGHWQTLEAAFDPISNQWFNVYGQEDRKAGEWGHWTGRGMNWNSMCAACHNTRLRKNYDATTDSYRTAMVERGVGCESCHGPLRTHNEWQAKYGKSGAKDPTLTKLTRQQTVDNCGFCHARRADLTGDFKPGDSFYDHQHPSIVDETDIFYPDGQVRDEDYEFAPFLGSRMHASGVYCLDCHHPHSMKTLLPGNWLCMKCHSGGVTNAPIIDPVAHSHHRVFGYDTNGVLVNPDLSAYKPRIIKETGGECVNCHMPQTAYMQRHWRHDHGFTIPDPLLTKQHGIPNACNRCHQDKSNDWSLEWTERWYGPKMQRPTRTRAQWVARARAGDAAATDGLLEVYRGETIPYWRAVILRLLSSQARNPRVLVALEQGIRDTNALVRAEAVNALGPLLQDGDPRLLASVRTALTDVSRNVRVAAARVWPPGPEAVPDLAQSELQHSLDLNADQPAGQFAKGLYLRARNDPEALGPLRQAVAWDPWSPPFHSELAAALSAFGRLQEAVDQLAAAVNRIPRDANLHFQLGLALSEVNQPRAALAALETAVRLDPRHGRAWYNLGLAQNLQNQPEAALDSLSRAETAQPDDAQIPYARATILARLHRPVEALKAVRRALELAPDYQEARQLENMIGVQKEGGLQAP